MMRDGAARPAESGWILLVAVLALADVTSMLETMMIFAALKQLMVEFGDASAVGWVVTSYLLVAAASTAISARLGDLYGHRFVLMVVLALTAIGSLISFLGDTNLSLVIAGRALQGVSGAILPLGMGIVRRHVPTHRVSLSVGILLSASGIAATVGLLVGGLLVDHLGWHYIFAVSGAFALASWATAFAFLPRGDTPRREGSIDLLGGVLFVPGIAAVVFAIGEQESQSGGPLAPASLVVGLVLLAVWARHEWRHPNPLIDVRLLASPWGASINLCTAIWAMSMLQLTQVQMIFLQQPVATGAGLGLTATAAAFVKMPAKAITAVVSPIAGQLCEILGPRRIVLTGFLLGAIGWVLLMFSHDNVWIVGTIMALFCAMGVTVVFTGLSTAAVIDAPADRTSEAYGMTMVTRTVSQAIGAQSIMAVLGAGAQANGGVPDHASYMTIFSAIAVFCVGGALVALRLPSKKEATAVANGVIASEHH